MIIRFSAFHQALAGGQFPVRFLPRLNFEYGYPVANFLYPGYMYLAEPLRLLKFGFVDSIKIVFALSLVASAIFTFLWLSERFSKLPAFAGSVVFLYAPYHLYDVFRRGSIGEALALSIVPFILWNIERESFLFTSLGIALLILSHNTLAFLFLPLIVVYLFMTGRNKKKDLLPVVMGILSSSFFWFPALYDLKYTVFSQTKVSEWGSYFADMGLISLPGFFLLLCGAMILFSRAKQERKLPVFFMALGIISIFFSSVLSRFFWNLLPISFIQFPFRFLSIEILSLSFITAYVLSVLHKRNRQIAAALIMLVFIISAVPYLTGISYFEKEEGFYSTNEDTTTVKNEYMPVWVRSAPSSRPDEKIRTEGVVSELSTSSTSIAFKWDHDEESKVTIRSIYFPGWKVKVDDKEQKILYDNSGGLIEFMVPAGRHDVIASFSETRPRLAADLVSLMSLCTIIALSLIWSKRGAKE